MVADASNVGIDRQRRFNNMANDTAVTPGAALSLEIMAENMKEVGVLGVLYFGLGIWGGCFGFRGFAFGVFVCVFAGFCFHCMDLTINTCKGKFE